MSNFWGAVQLSVFFVYIKFLRFISLHTTLDHIIDDGESYIGFPVDSGLATVVDAETIETYRRFYDQ